MNELSIGEVARQAGVRTSTLRYYESVGLLAPPRRVNGRRHYDPSVVKLLAVLRMARQAGFTVAEMRTLLHGFTQQTPPSQRWEALARKKLREVDALIARAEQMKRILEAGLKCGCVRLEDCVIVDGEQCAVR